MHRTWLSGTYYYMYLNYHSNRTQIFITLISTIIYIIPQIIIINIRQAHNIQPIHIAAIYKHPYMLCHCMHGQWLSNMIPLGNDDSIVKAIIQVSKGNYTIT